MHRSLSALAVAGVIAFSQTAEAAVVRSLDFEPLAGTTIADLVNPGGARFDFGGYGLGRVEFISLTPGDSFDFLTRIEPNFSATLGSGNQFVGFRELVFNLVGDDAGFTIRVTLDSGVLPTGSLFEIRSLDRSGAAAQTFTPGAGMGAVDPVQLPSDGSVPLVLSAGAFSAAADGISAGRAWDVGGVNSFSGAFFQDRTFGGVAITIAVPQVPAPSALLLLLGGLGVLGAARRALPHLG